ncbi:pyruvate dehydrogenase E2 component (dihydrolipoamide acetyltransferase) [Halospina denitrificans]|uniref:Dihydrolipoamide acetyltransferase component of pyruvate dehydrogenase complex n=1 Tax=Halospina denitrificans TaxID=332522 RepID=A0A4R7JZL7_9GAMM|nr:dihydrolipoamide acetyltransferase family protein [Halospina denitrificans]TDT43992.1 pyruvate dehydrogenase E2 component (dihydrolipoamide acetyltransferase) [Halospina denitrificans]
MSDFLMPSLGADMDSGRLVEWKVQPGDRVSKGQVIASVETAKAVMDVEVFEDGVVEALYVTEDTDVDVGTPLARIGDGSGMGQAASGGGAEYGPKPEPATPTAPEAAQTEPDRVPPEPASPPASDKRSAGERVPASPAARRKAREEGIPLSQLRGSGPDGAIVLRDLQGTQPTSPKTRPTAGFDPAQMRAAIAAAMSRSKREIPHYYLATTVDLHAAEQWLADYNEHEPPENRLLLSALFMKATALALARYSELNGHYGEDGFVAATQVNLGMAVHLRGGGLVAPAIMDADTLTLPELMHQLRDLVRRARGGGLRLSEMTGGTATVTALGDRGVDTVYGVIYPPQVAMIGIGRARRQPLAVEDGIAVRLAVDLSLAADHRVCDGHLGALFLNEIEQLLQQPEAL